LLNRFPVFVKLAVGADGFLRRLFRLSRGFLERLDAPADIIQLLRVNVERVQPACQGIERAGDRGGPLADLLE
jgi:hypothetical protein